MHPIKKLGVALLLTSACFAANTEEAAVNKRLNDFQAAWDKKDPKAVAAFWAEDGDLVNPMGISATGPAAIEKVVAGDMMNILRDGKTKFTVTKLRFPKPDVVIVDMTHEISGVHGPNGMAMPPMKLLVTGVAMKKAGHWMWLAARPMVPFIPPAPPAASAPAAPAPAK